MSIRARLTRLEEWEDSHRGSSDGGGDFRTEEDWLESFAEAGRRGCFAAEPDFPLALAAYRDAVRIAAVAADPPFFPPPDFLPGRPERRRVEEWRRPRNYPGVRAAFQWLLELWGRVERGTPPVTEAEFAGLAAWFEANAGRIYESTRPSQQVPLGGGRTTTVALVRSKLWRGARALGAGEAAEDVRQLMALYGRAGEVRHAGPATDD
jgi:hypothetical protein